MDLIESFPDCLIGLDSPMADYFSSLGIKTFHEACRYVHNMPYGHNDDTDDAMCLFKDGQGTCITKHAVISTLACELSVPVNKHIGIYAMTEKIVSGTDAIIQKYKLPWVPMTHCFLSDGDHLVDLTEGNNNGKNMPINNFLYTTQVTPDISEKEEYLLYRKVLTDQILAKGLLKGTPVKTILQAREESLALLKANILTNSDETMTENTI